MYKFYEFTKITFRPRLEECNAFIVTKEDLNDGSVTQINDKYRVIFANKFFYRKIGQR